MGKSFNPWRIRDVGDGNTGWVQGRLVGDPPLVAPISKRRCFHYNAFVADKVATATVDELTIEDETGRALVVMAGAVIQLDFDHGREGILGPGELIAAYGTCRWERDPAPTRHGLYRDGPPQRLRITGTSRVRLWVSEDVPGRI